MKQMLSRARRAYMDVSRSRRLVPMAIHSLKSSGIRQTFARIVRKVRSRLWRPSLPVAVSDPIQNAPSRIEIRRQREWSRQSGYEASFQLRMTVTTQSRDAIRKTVESLRRQTYPRWTLLIDCQTGVAAGTEAFLRRWQKSDPRIEIRLAEAERTTPALPPTSMVGPHAYVGRIDAGDTLTIDALYRLAVVLKRQPNHDVLYTDEAHVNRHDSALEHLVLKPDWSPELLLSYNYLGGLCLFRKSAFDHLGGFLTKYQDATEWDLCLRFMEHGYSFMRVPHCCYLRSNHRGATPCGTADVTNTSQYREALQDYLDRQGFSADAETCDNGVMRIRWRVKQAPRVSIIIPNKNSCNLITSLVRDLLHKTSYPNKQIVIVDNDSTDPAVWGFYREQSAAGHIEVVPFKQDFNYSAACNTGARAASGDLLLFLNNDIEVIHQDWLDELAGWALQPQAGVVGTKLLYPNGHIQHCGVVAGPRCISHIWHKAPSSNWGIFGTPDSCRNYLAVTGACHMLRRSVFDELGGYDERYQIAFSDVALCLNAVNKGYRVIYTPHAPLIHYESYTRGTLTPANDIALLAREISKIDLREDPYYHQGLSALSDWEPRRRLVGEETPSEMLRHFVLINTLPGADEPIASAPTPHRQAA